MASRAAGRVGGNEHGLDLIVLDHLFEGWICLLAAAGLGHGGAAVGDQVGDGHDFHVGVILETERLPELAKSVAGDAYADLAIRNGLPLVGRFRLLALVVEALDLFIGGACRAGDAKGGGSQSGRFDERTSRCV